MWCLRPGLRRRSLRRPLRPRANLLFSCNGVAAAHIASSATAMASPASAARLLGTAAIAAASSPAQQPPPAFGDAGALFDSQAAAYKEFRPTYPPALYSAIAEYAAAAAAAHASVASATQVEVGMSSASAECAALAAAATTTASALEQQRLDDKASASAAHTTNSAFPRFALAVDVATGSGQAARDLMTSLGCVA